MIGSSRQHESAREVAGEVRSLRLKAGHTQTSLARVLGVTRRSIVRWEAGRGRMHKIYLMRIRELGHTGTEVENAQL